MNNNIWKLPSVFTDSKSDSYDFGLRLYTLWAPRAWGSLLNTVCDKETRPRHNSRPSARLKIPTDLPRKVLKAVSSPSNVADSDWQFASERGRPCWHLLTNGVSRGVVSMETGTERHNQLLSHPNPSADATPGRRFNTEHVNYDTSVTVYK